MSKGFRVVGLTGCTRQRGLSCALVIIFLPSIMHGETKTLVVQLYVAEPCRPMHAATAGAEPRSV